MVDQSALRSQLDAIQTMTAMIVEKPKVVNKCVHQWWRAVLDLDFLMLILVVSLFEGEKCSDVVFNSFVCFPWQGDKNNGFDVLYHNMKHGQISSKELSDFIRER